MKYLYLPVLLVLISNTAFAKTSVEETVLQNAFTGYHVAEAYDEFCNKKTFEDRSKNNPNMVGNMQMIVSRLGGVVKKQNAKLDNKMAMDALRQAAAGIKAKTKKDLENAGCESKKAEAANQARTFFSSTKPEDFSAQLTNEIKQKGGTITPPLKK